MNNETVTESLIHKGSFWFPQSASKLAENVDALFYFILVGSIILFILVIGMMAFFVKKYKNSKSNPVAGKQVVDNIGLEIAWTVIPSILVMIVFAWGYRDFMRMGIPPAGAMEIRVTAKKWLWQFDYPREGITTVGEIVVPIGRPVKLIMGSEDVLHSFFLPNFRIKRDVIPNRYTRLWFQGDREGVFQLFCTEYCGDGHSGMLGTVTVVSEAKYQEWLKSGSSTDDVPLLDLGKKLYTKNACNTCHSIDGTASVGPTWKGLYGRSTSTDKGSRTANDDYLKEAILNSKATIVSGYQPVMPVYSGLLKDREVLALIEYIKSLSTGDK